MPTRGGVYNAVPGEQIKIAWLPFQLRNLGGEIQVGNSFWLDSGGSGADATDAGTFEQPFLTLDYAVSRCTANNGDIINIKPGHAETTTAIGLDVAGVTVRGHGFGGAKPTFTATTAATDLVNYSAANCVMENVRLVGAASGVTAIADFAADDCGLIACDILTGAAPVDIITVASGDRGLILGNTFIGTAAGPDNAILVESRTLDWVVAGNMFNYLEFDIDENIIDAPANSLPGWVITDNQMLGLALTALTIKSSVANKFTFIDNCTMVAHAAAATIANLLGTTIVGLMIGGNVFGTDTTQTERATRVPTATPA